MSQAWVELTPSLWTAQSGLFLVQSGVIVDSGEACLIDPGLLPGEIDAILRHVTDCRARLQTIVLTHCHWDHLLGPESLPRTRIVAHADYVTESAGRQGRRVVKQIAEWGARRGEGQEEPFPLPRPDATFVGETTLSVGRIAWQLIHAPGHAPDHAAAYAPNDGILWAADMLSEVEIPYVCHSLGSYQKTLERLAKLEIRLLVPAHGHATSNKAEIRARFEADAAYLAELRRRIERAVREGRTVDEAVELCADMRKHLPAGNDRPHRMNVESLYGELGGEVSTTNIGWRGLVEGVD